MTAYPLAGITTVMPPVAMSSFLAQLFPLLYGACFLLLLWQAFKVMGQGFRAVPRPGDPGSFGHSSVGSPAGGTGRTADGANRTASRESDRTGRLTIHPELLDHDGKITREDLLTVRFTGDNEKPVTPADPA